MERGKPERSNSGRARSVLRVFHNLTSDEIELLSWFSKLSERNQGKIIGYCIDCFTEQSGMGFYEFADILLNSEDYFSKYFGVALIKEKR